MRISYSALNTYQTCPLKFKFQELDKIRTPKGIEAIFGSTIHSALKYMFERNPLYPTQDEVFDFFRNKWETQKDSMKDMDPDTEKIFYNEGLNLLKRFYKANPPWNFNVVDLESRFEVEIEDPVTKEKHTLAGIVDRIDKGQDDGIYEIIDYKTAKRMPSQDSTDSDLQMSIYHLGLIKRWPHLLPENIKLSLYFLKHGEKISTTRSNKQLENTKKLILNKINEIEEKKKTNDFPPIPNALCDWCGYKQLCPMFKHLYSKAEAQGVISEDEIKNVVAEYFELKDQNSKNTNRLDELKDIIYGFMNEQKIERVFGDVGYITKKLQERFSYDPEQIKEILEPIGKWEEILSADEKMLEELLPTLPEEIKTKISALRKSKQFSTLTVSKKKNEK